MRQLSSALAAPAVAAALVKIKLRRGSGFGRLLSRRLNSTELLAYTPPRVCFFDRLFATRPLERFFVRPVELFVLSLLLLLSFVCRSLVGVRFSECGHRQ
jgi:hypothetical protein